MCRISRAAPDCENAFSTAAAARTCPAPAEADRIKTLLNMCKELTRIKWLENGRHNVFASMLMSVSRPATNCSTGGRVSAARHGLREEWWRSSYCLHGRPHSCGALANLFPYRHRAKELAVNRSSPG